MAVFSAASTRPETGRRLRFARVDGLTLTPRAAPEDRPALRVEAQPIETVPDLATIDLRQHIAKSSILSGDEERRQELAFHLGQELASAGILPRLVETHDLDALPANIRFHAGDHAALAAVIAMVPPRPETTIDVVFGGCLLHDDPIFGPPAAVDGFTPRIPGGAGPADAVFMPGLDCFAEGAGPVDLPVRAQAHVLAHELGHYLGLHHAVEEDGLTDQLDATDPDTMLPPPPHLPTPGRLAAGATRGPARSRRHHRPRPHGAHPLPRPAAHLWTAAALAAALLAVALGASHLRAAGARADAAAATLTQVRADAGRVLDLDTVDHAAAPAAQPQQAGFRRVN